MSSDSSKKILFTKQMREVTRELHGISDALVNAKLGLGMGDNRVWAEGLLCFYEVFSYLEDAFDRLGHTQLGELDIPGLRRKEAFERDLGYYYGHEWRLNYTPKESVTQYINHLKEIEDEDPCLLMVYVYHLYMGLLSGGQILKRKRSLVQKVTFSKSSMEGLAVVDFKPNESRNLKVQIVETVNSIAGDMGEALRQRMLEESKEVFVRNNVMVESIEGVGMAALWRVLAWTVVAAGIAFLAVGAARLISYAEKK